MTHPCRRGRMEAFMFLADEAASPDKSSFTVSRGGLFNYFTTKSPTTVVIHLEVHIVCEIGDGGDHPPEQHKGPRQEWDTSALGARVVHVSVSMLLSRSGALKAAR